ncbi:pectinesterase [Silene latifolia]|uniref:pectinesterase n=1 Tax=Silene latifolia TaxID=37657 RepID=UPI003D770886
MKQLYEKHNKLISTLIFSILLISSLLPIAIGAKSDHPTQTLSIHTILQASCSTTRYPDLCYNAIASAPPHISAKITNIKDVIIASLNLTTVTVEHNYFTVQKLIKNRKNLTIREKNALHDCLETIDETLDELRQALDDLIKYHRSNNFQKVNRGNFVLEDYVDDMKTLISSAITNQETCLDGFSHNNADKLVRLVLEQGQKHVEKMCSNALAMLKKLTDEDIETVQMLRTKNNKRQLYDNIDNYNKKNESLRENNWPRWMSHGDRRMLQQGGVKVDTVVAADGSGNHRTISAAVAAAPVKSKKRYVIKIKAGVYRENVEVDKKKTNLMFIGDGRSKTIITGSKNVIDGSTTYDSATVAIMGEGFLARDLTFQNTAGPSKHQAVALRVGSDLSAFYNCDILAYQDTLYVHNNRQFYINCLIAGTVDFIFGNAAVVFQDCDIHARKPNPGQQNMITAQSRTDPNQNTGIVIQKSRIGATSDLKAAQGSFSTYLGRPWKEYSRTVIMQSSISDIVHPQGWHEWEGNFALNTLEYSEYKNSGPGSDTSRRVKWRGVKVLSSDAQAQQFTPGKFIVGGSWLPSTSFPYSLGL